MRRMVAVFGIAVAALLFGAAPAAGWANGGDHGDGFGTHDWVLKEANRLAAKRSAGWVVLSAALPATDDPDTVFHDTYYHVYDIWGSRYGNAPAKVAFYFDQALALRRQGRYRAASRAVGRMAHYYADVCNPTHTDQTSAEERMHSAYEGVVNTRTDAAGEHRRWVKDDGYRTVTSARRRTRAAAVASHASYAALVSHYNAGGWSDATVRGITRRSLGRAVNGLADMIVTLKRLSPPR